MPLQRLQDLDLPLDLALLDRLKRLNDHLLVIVHRHAGVNLRVFTLSNFGDDLELVDVAGWRWKYPYSI